MRVSSLLHLFDALIETSVVARAQYLMSRTYRDVVGMREALETSLAVDQDVISLLTGSPFEELELSGVGDLPKIDGTPEEIVELLKKVKIQQSASITNLLNMPIDDDPEVEEQRKRIRDRKMDAVGNFFRRAKRILREQWDGWTPTLERQFASMLKLKAPRREKRR